MLSAEQVDMMGARLVPIFQQLEHDVICDIARRVRETGRWTETAELQAAALYKMGYSPAEVRAEVIRKLNVDSKFVAEIDDYTRECKAYQQACIDEALAQLKATAPEVFAEAGNMCFNNDLSLWEMNGRKLRRGGSVDRIIKQFEKRGTDSLMNLTKSMGFRTPTATVSTLNAYRSALNSALTKAVSGAFTRTEAVNAAIRELTRSGLRTVDFASGVTRQIDTAVHCAVRTSMNQMAGDIMQANIDEMGDIEYVQVSAHWGARPSHAAWEGKIYTMQEFRDICGYGDPGNRDHIYSYNCRHNHYPVFDPDEPPTEYPPEPAPKTVGGKTYTYYEATQKQRELEREIRAMKREAYTAEDPTKLNAAIRQKQKEYAEFSKAVEISAKPERLRVEGYDKRGRIRLPSTENTEGFNAYGDHLFKAIGSARENNRDELNNIISSVVDKGGTFEFAKDP